MAKYYDNIDNCPVIIFNKILEGESIDLLCYEGKPNKKRCVHSWYKLYNEYIKEFGLPKQYINYLKDMVKVCQLYNQAYNEGKRDRLTMARHKEKIASLEINTGEKVNFNKVVATVSKYMGYPIDPSKTSVRIFYSNIQLINNG